MLKYQQQLKPPPKNIVKKDKIYQIKFLKYKNTTKNILKVN